MLQQFHRPSTHRAVQARGHQRPRHAPPIKENRKASVPRNVVAMLDGTHFALKAFNDLRSTAPKRLKDDFTGIATRVRLAIADHEGAWDAITDWVKTHRGKYGDVGHQNDLLVATAIAYAATRFKRPVAEIIGDIMRTKSAKVLFPAAQ